MLKRIIRNSGFSLVEMATVLVIMSLSAGMALSLATSKTISDRIALTEERMDVIELAIAEFVRQNGRIPCPASGYQAVTSASFGVESMVDNGANNMNNCVGMYGSVGTVKRSDVPVRTLGLSDEYGFDGWGRRIYYTVDERYANSAVTFINCDGVTSSNCFELLPTDPDLSDAIDVGGAAGGSEKTSDAVYILQSFGANGHGATPKNGAGRIDKNVTDADEIENAHIDTAFDAQFVQKDMVTGFDDILRYKEKLQIISDIGANISESICDMAENVVDNPNPAVNLTCTGATSVANCESLATEIDRVCAGLYN